MVFVYTDSGPEAYTYKGGPAVNIPKSCEKAAQAAVSDIMATFNVWVQDISISKRREFERCADLYRLKRKELTNIQKGLLGASLVENLNRGPPLGTVPVFLDFPAVLRRILSTCNIHNSGIESIAHGHSKYTAWITISTPTEKFGRRTFFSIRCNELQFAQNNLAKQVIEFLIPIYNLEIIDVNYNPRLTAYTAILCALEMESYLAVKERFLAMEIATPMPGLLPLKKCSAQKKGAATIPSMISVPVVPKNKLSSDLSMEISLKKKMRNGKRKSLKIPQQLATVFKRVKYSNNP